MATKTETLTPRGCAGKVRYRSAKVAYATRARILARHDDLLDVYSCGVCGWLHLGHPPVDRKGR